MTPEQLEERLEAAIERVIASFVDATHATGSNAPLLDDTACAVLLGISPKTLRCRLIPAGMPFVRVGDVRRYERAAVLALVRGDRESEGGAKP
jgi:hypothetical protein